MIVTIARLIALVAVLLFVASLAAYGQPGGKLARLALVLFDAPATNPNLAAFLAGLRDLGYVDGRNVVFDYRHAEGRPERVRELGPHVASLKPDVIVVLGGDMVPSVKDATSTIPIVMLTSLDPLEAGVIASFARPGNNVTGVAFVSSETAGKRLQFLKEAAPSLTRIAVLWTQTIPMVSIATPRRPRVSWASRSNRSKSGDSRTSMRSSRRLRARAPGRSWWFPPGS